MYIISGIEEGCVKIFFRTLSIRRAHELLAKVQAFPGVTFAQIMIEARD